MMNLASPGAVVVDLAAYRAANPRQRGLPDPLALVERPRPLSIRAIEHRTRMLEHLRAASDRAED
jgi:hypothetical protein